MSTSFSFFFQLQMYLKSVLMYNDIYICNRLKELNQFCSCVFKVRHWSKTFSSLSNNRHEGYWHCVNILISVIHSYISPKIQLLTGIKPV